MSEPKEQTTLQSAYEKLFSSGVLMQVHVSKWSMASKLSLKDLKLDKEIPEDLFQFGKKLLMPAAEKHKFEQMESKARAILRNNAFQFPIAQAHFVPSVKIVKVMQELDAVRVEYFALVDAFLAQYDVLKAQMLAKYPTYGDVLTPYYPPIAAIRAKYDFSVSHFQIDFPKELKETSFQELLIQEGAKTEALAEYKKQMADQYDHALNTMHSFVNESVYTLRSEATKACKYVYEKIQRGEPVTKTNLNTVTDMIKNFESMNFFSDSEVSGQLAQLKRIVNSEEDFRNDADAITALSTALNAVVEKATTEEDTSIATTYFRAIEV